MSARPGGGEGLGKGFVLWEKVYFIDGGCGGPGGGSFVPASERSEHRWSLGGRRTGSPGGDKDHERSEYRSILERQEFVVRNGA
jgi:hypothetical protein